MDLVIFRMRKNKKINKPEGFYVKALSKKNGILLLVIILIFLLLTGRLGYIQFVKGAEYKKAAYMNQTINKIISPKRGIIYDSTGKVLATSADVDTITINPGSITYKNGEDVEPEKLANAFVDIFGLDYQTVLDKINSSSSVETIIRKVEQDKVSLLETWLDENNITSGINIDDDVKRYYPHGTLASQLIGFCGDDNTGLEGLENEWDDVLTGTPGKIITSSNVIREEIPDENQTYIAPENGNNLVLSIDVRVQSILEKYLEQAVIENECTRGGTAIAMNPSTGDILGMANYPYYNLNTPFEPGTEDLKAIWDTLSSSEQTEQIQYLWRNRAVTDGYEPGSTFKLITSSIALEENLVEPDTEKDFICTGSETVYDYEIECWRAYDPHGEQSLRKALMNSCNPAFIQLANRIGPKLFFKYFDAYGLLDRTDVALPGETSGYFFEGGEEGIGAVELATMSFGQRFLISPLQMLTAVCAIANDGVLMQPRIVKQIINADNGSVTNIEPKEVRQVISQETAETMQDLMKSVTQDGTGRNAKVAGYSIGGKTGTSEPSPGREEDGYTSSYVAIAPTSNAQIALLVILYDAQGENGHQGGTIVGPVVAQILSELLPYLGIASTEEAEEENTNSFILTDLTNKTVAEAKRILEGQNLDAKITIEGNENESVVINQVPKPGVSLEEGGIVYLYTAENTVSLSTTVPDLKGMSLSQAKNALKAQNLNINYTGSGVVISQDEVAGSQIESGSIINVILQEEGVDTY